MNKKIDMPDFISSGSTLLNLALSGKVDGGWRIGRICNIVGDKSTGKTLLAIELITYALKAFTKLRKDSKVKVIYNETESAFDIPYAEILGMPVDLVDFAQSDTVEAWHNHLKLELDKDDYDFMVYVIDSLDALSTEQEKGKEITDGSYTAPIKGAKMSELFRRLTQEVSRKKALVVIISQIRDKIGVVFGKKYTRSGGRGMDFYASQVIYLAEKGKLKISDRVVGVNIRAKVDKNKVWKPYREAEFPILFEYGIDDVGSMVDFLIDQKVIQKSGPRYVWKDKKIYRENLIVELEDCKEEVVKLVEDTWNALEEKCKVKRKPKYE